MGWVTLKIGKNVSGLRIRQDQKIPSLRTRYIGLTFVLGLLIVITAAFFYRGVVKTGQEVAAAYEGIHEDQNNVEAVRNNLLKIYRDIDFFLLDPLEGKEAADNAVALISASIENIKALAEADHPDHISLKEKTDLLLGYFSELKLSVPDLIALRMDVSRQYPGLALSANQMIFPQDAIKSQLALLVDEIEAGDIEPASAEIYPLLLKTYALWIGEISQLRIYMANRFASFSTEILIDQATSLNDLHDQFNSNISRLQQLYRNEDSFEGPALLESIEKNALSWFNDFVVVREISESSHWRGDNHAMRSSIIPLSGRIVETLQGVDVLLRMEQTNVSERSKLNSETLSSLIMIVIALFLLFIVAILVSLDFMVFEPIKNVAQALRSKAFNTDLPHLQGAKTREVGCLIEAFREMDNEVSHRQNALEHQALHDHLTGLPNRFMLNQRIQYQLLSAERAKQSFTLFLMDLDHFKDINDTLGHAIGDALLIEVSKLISTLVRKSDTVARLGGDEFAVLLPDTDRAWSSKLAKKIFESLAKPFLINGHRVNIGVSIGIVSYPDDGEDAMSLLQYADMAMYVAKRKRIGFSHYEANENIYSEERLTLINDLQDALENNHFELYFQPKLETESEAISGAEALLRWNHSKLGYISPEKIIELAEHIGIIHLLSGWVLEGAITQCGLWHRSGHKLSISVNLSVRDLSNETLCEDISRMLKHSQLPSEYLTLEITEGVMMENFARSIEVLNTLNEMKVNISIDDFGTGFSSLAYLKRLPVKELKIDKSFIIDMDTDESDAVIVQSTINLGHNLGLKVVAEGIENREVMDMVKDLGCDQVQGYYFGKPQTCDEFTKLLEK